MSRSAQRRACSRANRAIDQASRPTIVPQLQVDLQDARPVVRRDQEPLQPSALDREVGDRGADVSHGPAKVAPLLINGKQFRERLGISATKFWMLKKAGVFNGLLGPIHGLYSVAKIERWINDEPEARRRSFSSHKRSA